MKRWVMVQPEGASNGCMLLLAKGVEFTIPPHAEDYGIVAVFKDLYGNLWDLIEPAKK